MFRKKKNQTGSIKLLMGTENEMAIEYKPQLLIKDLINAAAKLAGVKTFAIPFFGLMNEKTQRWLYPYRCLTKEEAVGRYYLQVQLLAKNSIELRRIDAVAFEYFFLQCRSTFVLDAMKDVDLNDALRLACLDIRLATLRLKLTFDSLMRQFPVTQFLPKSIIGKFVSDALMKVLKESFSNFTHMADEAAMLRYAEIMERQPGFHTHAFSVAVVQDSWSAGETVSLQLSFRDGIIKVKTASSFQRVSSFGDLAALKTFVQRDKFFLDLSCKNGTFFSCQFPSYNAMDSFVSFVDGYYQLLVDSPNSLHVEGIIQPDATLKLLRVPSRRLSGGTASNGGSGGSSPGVHSKDIKDPSRRLSDEKELYHGPISREEAKRILESSSPSDGFCLVRENARVKGGFSLSVWRSDDVRHYLVELHSKGYGIQDGLRFRTIRELLRHYQRDKDGLCCTLTTILPPAKPSDSPFLKPTMSGKMDGMPPVVPESPRPTRFPLIASQQLSSIEFMSTGQFGPVSKAVLSNTDLVCVKSLTECSPRVKDSLYSLCTTLRRFENTKVVKFLGAVSNGAGSELQLTYEFVPLGPLDVYLSRNRLSMKERTLLLFSSQIASGLAFLESEDFVHGGLTAHNVLVATPDSVKISDAGLAAKAAFVNSEHFDVEKGPGRHLIAWLALECLKGASIPTATSDVWSFGVVLWEISNYGEKKPFEGLTPSQIKNLVIGGQRLDAASLQCTQLLAELMVGCWNIVPSVRPPARQLFEKILYLVKKSSLAANEADMEPLERETMLSSSRPPVSSLGLTRSLSIDRRPPAPLPQEPSSHIRSSSSELQSDSQRLTAPSLPEKRRNRHSMMALQQLIDTATNRNNQMTTTGSSKVLSIQDLGLQYLSRTSIIEPSKLHLGRELGHGEFGVVRQATWKKPDGTLEETAVKMLTAEGNIDVQQEFLREAKAMIELESPFVVRLLGICFEPTLLLVTELVSLGPVNGYLRSLLEDQIKVPVLMGYVWQIALGMTYLEVQRVVHRDLAARNVLVATPTSVKITDFGLSRIFAENQEYYVAHTKGKWPIKWQGDDGCDGKRKKNRVYFRFRYAPESINHQKFTHKSDVWSYGITSWEIFSLGMKPYSGMKPRLVLNFVESGKRLRRPELCPENMYKILEDCWLEEPEDRPTFTEIAKRVSDLNGAPSS
eukprot:m.29283 g.29283  ORF g.29283 m.29283 type:complete len:1178 (+) comp31156_c0_seq2:147-3680(+)